MANLPGTEYPDEFCTLTFPILAGTASFCPWVAPFDGTLTDRVGKQWVIDDIILMLKAQGTAAGGTIIVQHQLSGAAATLTALTAAQNVSTDGSGLAINVATRLTKATGLGTADWSDTVFSPGDAIRLAFSAATSALYGSVTVRMRSRRN